MPIVTHSLTMLGQPAGPLYQAEAELGSAPATKAAKPPPRSNRPGNATGKTRAARTSDADKTEIEIDAAVETGTAAAGGAAETQPVGQAPNPLASAIALMTASAPHRHLFIADLEWALLPPIALRQCRVFVRGGRPPVGFASWAFVSDEVEARLKAGQTKLKPAEWKSGDRCWIVDLIAPFGGAAGFVRMLTEGVLKAHTVSLSAPVRRVIQSQAKTVTVKETAGA